jgi:hypothetical protein
MAGKLSRQDPAATVAAAAEPAAAETQGVLEEVRAFNRRGLFLGGAPKSGTTLLLSLLDGHPKLVVLPEETHFLEEYPSYAALGSFQAKLRRLLEKSDLRLLGQGKGAPSSEAPSSNVRDYSGFDHDRFARLAAHAAEQSWVNDSLLFSETARAYAIAAGYNWRECVRWVEKSTSNEACPETLFGLFPEAKLLQVVRDPRAVFASRKKRLVNRSGHHTKAHRLVREWNRSTRRIPQLLPRGDQYLVIRYEDFVQAPQEGLEKVCQFIGIECLPELFNPTRGGRQWQGNSSFHTGFSGISAASVDQWKKDLTEDEVWWIEMHCRQGMQLAGYPLQTGGRFSLSRWLKRLPGESWEGYLRARRASLCQLAGLLEHCRYDLAPAGAPARMPLLGSAE